jgi:hypothetical protein
MSETLFRAEIHDRWYVVANTDQGHALAIGTYLPPPNQPGVTVANVEPDEARIIMADLAARTIGAEAALLKSVRVAHNNRLLMVGVWAPPEGLAGIQIDAIMPDQARELLDELKVRSEGPSLVGTLEGKG